MPMSFEPPPVRLLDQLRSQIRYLHYSIRTEEAYVHWVRAFVRYHGLRHPKDMGAGEVQAFVAGGAVRSPLDALAARDAPGSASMPIERPVSRAHLARECGAAYCSHASA